ncbi:penicillin acylase family protein [Sphingomonas hankookensis]|uniref:penicillin acylase family protein n=1 Tax=Sphingomonas hankookensis TaxID=563996 RepID=UPI003D3022A8
MIRRIRAVQWLLSIGMALPAAAVPSPHAARVSIVRDDIGIAHVHGRSDADAVFGMIYAQAEDDFPRIERNYLTALGRRAEVDGEGALWLDLRQRLFVDPATLPAEYRRSPAWLRRLMDAWAAGLNQYLADHPTVRPTRITRFEPWMALAFSEGSIGGDIERGVDPTALAAFYRTSGAPRSAIAPLADAGRAGRAQGVERHRHRPVAQRQRQSPVVDQPAHLVLFSIGTTGQQ